MAIDELIHRLTGYRRSGPIDHRVAKYHLSEEKRPGPRSGSCPICLGNQYWGLGDVEPFLDRVGYIVGALFFKLLVRLRLLESVDVTACVRARHPKPDALHPDRLIVERSDDIEKWACFQCPGECGEKIMLSISQTQMPRWRVVIDWFGRPTIEPSIRQVNECRCHFWIRRAEDELNGVVTLGLNPKNIAHEQPQGSVPKGRARRVRSSCHCPIP